jgi:rhamnulokinase
MMRYLAFDLGAESGRALVATVDGGKLSMEEIHRWANEPVRAGGTLYWDVLRLWHEMRIALVNALDKSGALLQNPVHYRDSRTDHIAPKLFEIVPAEELYALTGVQFMQINTLFQVFALSRSNPAILGAARHFVTVPDLLNYWLTGRITCEYTNASTTQMLDANTRDWARDMLASIGFPTHILQPLTEPGSVLGSLRPELGEGVVIAPACHDTGSAVAAIEASGDTAFISSGTWSLMGTESPSPIITPVSRLHNFTNEGGVGGAIRLLKNIMGMWLLQCCRKQWNTVDYGSLVALAKAEPVLASIVDPDHPSFLHPESMTAAIDAYCRSTHQPVPVGAAGYVQAIFESLALKYRYVLESLAEVTGQTYRRIRVIGGGARNATLNQYVADATGCVVIAGPVEATALGNIAMQMVATGAVDSIAAGRELIASSFPAQVFEPRGSGAWDAAYARFKQYVQGAKSATQ